MIYFAFVIQSSKVKAILVVRLVVPVFVKKINFNEIIILRHLHAFVAVVHHGTTVLHV